MIMNPFSVASWLAGLLLVPTALAAPLAAQTADVVGVSLLPGWQTAQGDHVAGLAIRLAPGWKTYWRSPGDAGIPPQIDWSGSVNLDQAAIRWPVPTAFDINGMTSIGYDRDVILPLHVAPQNAAAPVRLDAQIALGVCETICVPVHVHVTLDLPPQRGPQTAVDPHLVTALDALPQTATAAGVGRVTCRVTPTLSGLRVLAEVAMPPLGPTEIAVMETADPDIWVGEAITRRDGDVIRIEADMEHVAGQALALDWSGVRLTVLAGARGVDIVGCD